MNKYCVKRDQKICKFSLIRITVLVHSDTGKYWEEYGKFKHTFSFLS